MINKEPIYRQINKVLRDVILKENYQTGDRFLTERAICKDFDVSRVTANKALSSLVSENILEFKKGIGTFIKNIPTEISEQIIFNSFIHNAKRIGKTPTSEILEFSKIDSDKLGQGKEKNVYKILRLRMADSTPVSYEERLLSVEYCPGLQKEAISGSFYTLLKEKYDLLITETEDNITTKKLNKYEAELLNSNPGESAFVITTIDYIVDHIPVSFVKSIYKPGSIEIKNHTFNNREQRLSINIIKS